MWTAYLVDTAQDEKYFHLKFAVYPNCCVHSYRMNACTPYHRVVLVLYKLAVADATASHMFQIL